MASIWSGLVDLIFPNPQCCKLCEQPMRAHGKGGICRRCIDRLPLIVGPTCHMCGKPLRLQRENSNICSECGGNIQHFYERSVAVGLYEGTMRHYIHGLKYYRNLKLAEPLGALMAIRIREEIDFKEIQGVVPVPLSDKKLEERGFNQSLLLSQVICHTCKKPLLDSCLQRVRDTPPQSNLSRQARMKNLRGAFQVVNPGQVSKKQILLVDDIYTTGSTVDECARVLLRSGALKVYVLTLAIGVLDSDWSMESEP